MARLILTVVNDTDFPVTDLVVTGAIGSATIDGTKNTVTVKSDAAAVDITAREVTPGVKYYALVVPQSAKLSVTVTTALRFYTESGQELTFDYATMDHGAVDVTLTVYKTAQLPINVRFVNTPPNFDPSVLIYSLSQTELRVAGPAAAVDNLSELAVGTIDLSTFALDKVYEMPITLPSGLVALDNVDTVTVSFNCSAMDTKTLNIPAENVEVINLPSTYQLTVETDRLMNVTLCGPAAVLEGLTADQVVARIDADDFAVALGQQNIACSIYVPADGRVFALGSYTIPCQISSE